MLWAPRLPNLYFTPSQCLTVLFKWDLSIFLRFAFASLTLRSTRRLETLLFLILSNPAYVCAMPGSQYTVWLSQLPWLGGAPGSYCYLEVKWGEESWGSEERPRSSSNTEVPQPHNARAHSHQPNSELYPCLFLFAWKETDCTNSLLFPVKNPVCSHFKLSSPNIAKGFSVHRMVLLILMVSLKCHILAVEF